MSGRPQGKQGQGGGGHGGGVRSCYNCGKLGHISRDCTFGGPCGGQSGGGGHTGGGGVGGPPRGNSGPARGDGGGRDGTGRSGGQLGGFGGGQRGGFSGGQRGGFSGGQRGGGKPRMDVSEALYDLPERVTRVIIQEATMGWHNVERELNGNPVPPRSKGPGSVNQRIISLTTNNLALQKLDLPEHIYQYAINIDMSENDKREKAARQKKKPPQRKRPPHPNENGNSDAPRPKLWKKICKALIELIRQRNQPFATDFMKMIYSAFPLVLEDEYRIILSSLEDEGKNSTAYVCTVTPAGQPIPARQLIRMGCLPNLNEYFLTTSNPIPDILVNVERALSIALKTTLNVTFTAVGRFSFYEEPRKEADHDLTGGIVNWPGFSTILTMGWKTFVNVDIANTAFVKGQFVYDALRNVAGHNGPKPENAQSYKQNDVKQAMKLLKGVMVEYWTRAGAKMTGRITDILPRAPRDETFEDSNTGRQTNVEEYFRQRYNITLQYRKGLCLQIRGKAVVPAELCKIVKGQPFNAKLNEAQTAKMIRETAVPPSKRLDQITKHVENIKLEQDSVLETFGVTVDTKLHQVEARVLAPPTLVYESEDGQKWVTPPKDGVWNMFERGHRLKFFIPANPKGSKWGVINADIDINYDTANRFVRKMIQIAQLAGLDLGNPASVMTKGTNYVEIEESGQVQGCLQKFANNGFTMALVIVPQKDKYMYGATKIASEIKMTGQNMVLTQVVRGENVYKNEDATVQNILLKINMKLGGTNYLMHTNTTGMKELGPWKAIDLLRAPILIIGADVTHPGVESKYPSFACVTASLDRTGMPYQMFIKAQRKAEKGAAEVITDLREIIKNFIMAFIENTGHKPRKILYYRDGVGDGQFGEVLNAEMIEIREGCALVSSDAQFYTSCENDVVLGEGSLPCYQPKITFVAVQKRHKVRFFVNDPNDGVGKNCNSPPGTIVDTDIVKSTMTDFYLLSHLGIQGTSRPTRYQTLWDDSDFTLDHLATLTYYLCFMYCRCNRSVSYPGPTYYAHLGATRAKTYADSLSDDILADIERVNEEIKRLPEFQRQFRMHFV